MGKKRKRKKRTQRATTPSWQPRGFDYGCLPLAVAVSSFDFHDHLNAASVDGVAYGSAWSDAVGSMVPTVTLVGQRGDALAKAFELFNAWSTLTGPDSVDISFILRNDGGYLLTISAEHARLERRCMGFDRAHQTVLFTPIWVKPMATTSSELLSFREYCSNPLAPLLLDGAVCDPAMGFSLSLPPAISPIPWLKPVINFATRFVNEAAVAPNTPDWVALNLGRQQQRTPPKSPPKTDPREIASQRVRTLRCHFPVTLERFRRSSDVGHLVQHLGSEGIPIWQIEQALCNLVLSDEMGCSSHYLGLSERQVQARVLEALQARYELADGAELSSFSFEEVRTQIVADGNALLRRLGNKKVDDLVALQAALDTLSVRDAAPAVPEICTE